MGVKILIVDDEPNVLAGYQRSLRKQFNVDTATSAVEALKKIQSDDSYAVVVSDMQMPKVSGLKLLGAIKEIKPDITRIMLTGNADQKTAVDAVNVGSVFRFLTKPCSVETMTEVISAGLAQFHQIQERRKQSDQGSVEVDEMVKDLIHQTQHDQLTGFANRQALDLRMQSFLESARDEGLTHALCYIDLDHFHIINDNCGFFAGDECLKQIAEIISSQHRRGDEIARLGSNTYCILFHGSNLEEAEHMALGILELIRGYNFEWEEELFDVNASVGLVPITQDSTSVAELQSAVETACNVVKDNGGNNLHVGNPGDRELTQRLDESQWISRINIALRDNRFQLYYQTIHPVGLAPVRGQHYEILVRMLDHEDNVLAPKNFLKAAENYWLSPKIDCWVIREVARWLEEHPSKIDELAMCTINLSGHSLGNTEVFDTMLRAFNDSGVPREKICFEITETTAITRLKHTVQFVTHLKNKGFLFALDDFGSGFSSFAYLKNIPVDYVKIDGQFVKNIHEDIIDRAMVKSINEIAQAMGKLTIAENVENKKILRLLEDIGVDFYQGFCADTPVPLDSMLGVKFKGVVNG